MSIADGVAEAFAVAAEAGFGALGNGVSLGQPYGVEAGAAGAAGAAGTIGAAGAGVGSGFLTGVTASLVAL